MIQHPAQRGLGQRANVTAHEKLEALGVIHPRLDFLARIAGVQARRRENCIARDCAGEKTVRQRFARHDTDLLSAEILNELPRLAIHQTEDNLNHIDLSLRRPGARHFLRVFEFGNRMPDKANLAFAFELGQGFPNIIVNFFCAEWRMKEQHVEMIALQASQALFH